MEGKYRISIISLTKRLRLLFSVIFMLSLFSPCVGQSTSEDKITLPTHKYFKDHNPTKAMWMSAALPGLGQYYNKKYWKIPMVYAGFTTLAYFSIINQQEYAKFRDAYSAKLALNGGPSDDPLINNYSSQKLLSMREFYQSNLELNYILFGVFYLLQIVDAAVDAHFYEFDINDNLSIGLDPILYRNRNQVYAAPGLQIRYSLGNP